MDSRFVLVPISSVSGIQRLTQNFHLSSTDLFHSPAGTIKLSLFLNAKTSTNPTPAAFADSPPHSSATSQLLSDKNASEDYSRIEFPDVSVVDQNQHMVSEYFAKNGAPVGPWLEKPNGSFLHLGAAPPPVEDYEMAGNSSDEYVATSVSPVQSSGFLSSTMTSLSDDRNSAESMEKKGVAPLPKTSEEENERRRRRTGAPPSPPASTSALREIYKREREFTCAMFELPGEDWKKSRHEEERKK